MNRLPGVTQRNTMDTTGHQSVDQHLAYDGTSDEDLDRIAEALSARNRRNSAALTNPQDNPS